MSDERSPKNPRRVAAGKKNVLKRKGLTPAGRERVRAATLANRPWQYATGPRTPEGKARSAAYAKASRKGALSVRELRAEMRVYREMMQGMMGTRETLSRLEFGSNEGYRDGAGA